MEGRPNGQAAVRGLVAASRFRRMHPLFPLHITAWGQQALRSCRAQRKAGRTRTEGRRGRQQSGAKAVAQERWQLPERTGNDAEGSSRGRTVAAGVMRHRDLADPQSTAHTLNEDL